MQGRAVQNDTVWLFLALTKKAEVSRQPPNGPYLGKSGGRNRIRTCGFSLVRRSFYRRQMSPDLA